VADQQHSLARRILLGMSGQAFARAANSIYAVALVPLLIGAWGVQGYGEWVSLVALISYASYVSFGVATTGGNEIVMAIGAGDVDRARRGYQVCLNLSTYIMLPLLLIGAVAAWFCPFETLLNLRFIARGEAIAIAWLFLLQIWLGSYRGLLAAILHGYGRYAKAYLIEGAARVLELASIAAAILVFHARPLSVAAITVSATGLDLLTVWWCKRTVAVWARPDFRVFDLQWIASQIRPGFGFVLSNFTSQSLFLQGPRVALGIVSGGHAVAIYSVYGTALRLVDQVVLLVAAPLEVEVAQSLVRRELDKAYRLIRLGTQFAWMSLIACSAALMLLGPWVFHVWTADRIAFDHTLMVLFVLIGCSAQIGRVSSHALIGANRTYDAAIRMTPVAIAALAIGSIASLSFGVAGMGAAILVGELAASIIVIQAVAALVGRPTWHVLRDLLDLRTFARAAGPLFSATLGSRMKHPAGGIPAPARSGAEDGRP